MADQTAPEPTMEEILASIRRIISDDDQPGAGGAEEEQSSWSAPAPADAAEDEDDVLDLTEPVTAAGPSRPPAEEAASRPPSAVGAREASAEPLVGGAAAATAASAFGRLSAAAARPPSMAMPAPGRTLEDVTRELLRPMLKQWLDDNLAAIVQQRVDEEVERIARGRVR